jgi:fermentation-respiration switch protein FrsA (DUF1100 family)
MKRVLILGVSALLLFGAGSVWLFFYPALPADLGGATNLDRTAEKVSIPTADGDTIDGWYLRGTEPAVVLLLHGHGREHRRMWRYGGFLHKAGYGVLAIDFRSARTRDRKPTTLGHYETIDAQAALDWLRKRSELEGHVIGIFGESLGGSVALVTAAKNPDVLAIVDDCGFASGHEAIEDGFRRVAHLPAWPGTPLLRSTARAVTGVDPGALEVRPAAAALKDRGLLFISCDHDGRISPEQTRALWRAAGERHRLWMVSEAGHNEGWKHNRAAYEDTVTSFFAEHLLLAWAKREAEKQLSGRTHGAPMRAAAPSAGGAKH